MLVDINAYIGHWPFMQRRYNTCESLLGRMNKFGVEISVISNLHGLFYKNTQSANEELYDEIRPDRRFRDRFIPFAVINPIYAGWRDDLEVCVKKMGMKGVRLYPKYHDYEINDPSLIECVKRIRDHGLPVAFTIRMEDSRTRSWMDVPYVVGKASPKKEWTLMNIVPVVKAVPDAKYMILNVANGIMLRGEELELFRMADILFDTSGRQVNTLPDLLKTYGMGKFAFGTHSPFLDYLTGMLRIEALRDSEADAATKELLRSGNAKRMLGL
jgi:predicted TIM-barrel fold metal-dependent hydrolase